MKQTMQHTRHRLATLLLLVVAMIIPQVANAVGTQPSGSGTSASPYLIATADNLLWFADQVNNGNGGICAKLTANITLEKQDYEHTHRYMIGTSHNPFYGEFDGNNKTVSGVFREYPERETSSGYYYAGGLFGCIKASTTTTAVVKNLTVKGNIIPPGNIKNVYYIGGVIGIAYGNVIVDNVKSRVNIDIPLCEYVDAHCGGVVASVEWFGNGNYEGTLTVSNCINYGNLNVECGEICGGVVGYIRNGSITDCLNVGSIENKFSGTTAGILGYVNSKGCTLSRCLNVGTIKASKAYSVYYKKDNIGSTSNLYYKSGVGGTALKATEVSDEQLKSGEVAYLLSQGTWGQSLGNNSVNDAYPYPNKTAYKVYQSGSNYYNNITSIIPTGDFTTTIETTAQYITNQTRIGDTRSFTVKPTATTGRYIEKVTHNGSTLYDQGVNDNTWTYSYTVALNNNFAITTADISYTMNANQSTTTLNLADNTIGSTETFTATPQLGYYITGATINGTTIAGTAVSGKTDGTKSFSFTVREINTITIKTAAISCTKTLNQSTTTLNIADNYVGSKETFTVTPKAGNYVTNVMINGETVAGSAVSGKTDGTKSYSFTVKESNTLTVNTEAIVCTTTLGESTSTLNISDNYVGSIETFTVTPKAGYYITGATINGETINGTAVSGKTDGTKSFSFTVKESNAVTINTAAIAYTKPTGSGFTTNLPDVLQFGSTVEFTVKPTAGNYITTVLHNDNELTPSATDADGTKHYSFTVSESNTLTISTSSIGYTKPTGSGFTTNLPDVLQFGSTVEFTVKPTAGNYITTVLLNNNKLAPSATDADGTKHYSFMVSESNHITVNKAAIGYTKPTGDDFTTNLPDNLKDKQIGSIVEFIAIPKEGKGICEVIHNNKPLSPSATDTDGTRHYAFTVAEQNIIIVTIMHEIANAEQLYWFAEQVNNGNTGINARLAADIIVNEDVLDDDGDLNGDGAGFRVWTPIGNSYNDYKGIFDGQGHTISGLYYNNGDGIRIGLFGQTGYNSKITNVGVVDSYFCGNAIVGGVCGQNYGTITNCYNTGVVKGDRSIGGVCGRSNVTVTNCYNTGVVNGREDVGGVCGFSNYSTITNCYNMGAINGKHGGGVCGYSIYGTITNCYNMGAINGQEVGGVCGYFLNDTIANAYYLEGTADQGVGYVYSGTPETTAMTADQFKSGEVAWLLNGSEAGDSPAWRQTIGEDKYPVLDAKKGIVVYSNQIGLNPIVRPTAGTLVGASNVYNFAGIEGKEVFGIPQTGTLAAGHPYVFTTDYEYVSFVPSEENVTDDTPTCGLTGVLEPAGKRVYGQNNTEGEDVSIVFTADALKYANTKGYTVKYGSCYINAGECFVTSGCVPAMARSIAFFGAGGTTGIDGTEAANDDQEGKAYNLQGVEVGKDYKGVVIVNGRKMVRK